MTFTPCRWATVTAWLPPCPDTRITPADVTSEYPGSASSGGSARRSGYPVRGSVVLVREHPGIARNGVASEHLVRRLDRSLAKCATSAAGTANARMLRTGAAPAPGAIMLDILTPVSLAFSMC